MGINNTQYKHQYSPTYFYHNILIQEKWHEANQLSLTFKIEMKQTLNV